ncbi:MAG: NOP5/NOP56 family protein [Candidatus Aenigmatarchaeota archaeon]
MSEIGFIFLVADIPGVFAFDRDKNLVATSPFPRDAEEIEEKLDMLKEGKVTEELEDVVGILDTQNIVTELPVDPKNFDVELKDEVSASEYLRNNLRSLSKDSGFVENDREFNKIMRDIQILRTRKEIKSSVKKDKVAAQAVSALQDLRRITNELSERLQEWYGLYYPELSVEENEKYAELAAELDGREDFEDYAGSMGIDLDRKDIEAMRSFARQVKSVYEQEEEIKEYLENVMKDIAPNVTHIIGAEMAAQLISLAGSLKKLARMPSSKIQLLGAEKALFRHLKGGGKPPKHGIIYNHPYIQQTPEDKRGKAARAIASKLMMAARTDQYTDKFKGEKYKEKLQKELEEIRNE